MRRMKSVQSHPSAALLGVANKPPLTWELPQPKRPIALKVATLLDGKGGTLRDTVVVVSGDKIERIGGPVPQGAQVYDLGGMTVAPGLIDTPMAQRAVHDPAIQEFLRTKQPLAGGPGRADDCSAAAVFLCSDAAHLVTGIVLPVDAGWSVSEGQYGRLEAAGLG